MSKKKPPVLQAPLFNLDSPPMKASFAPAPPRSKPTPPPDAKVSAKADPITEDEFCWAMFRRLPAFLRCEHCRQDYRHWAYHRAVCPVQNSTPTRKEPEAIERSPNSDPASLCTAHPYKGPGVEKGEMMARDKWARPTQTSNRIARVEAGPEYFDELEARKK
jgi:hypothetical protein